jgi:hypothetical protein
MKLKNVEGYEKWMDKWIFSDICPDKHTLLYSCYTPTSYNGADFVTYSAEKAIDYTKTFEVE